MLVPNLNALPAPQRALWSDPGETPEEFTLYGGTALALRLGHRTSPNFDFFSNASFDPDLLARKIPYIRGAERVQVGPDTLTCRVERDGPVSVSFFGGLGQVAARERVLDVSLYIASLLDIAGTKAAVVQKRRRSKITSTSMPYCNTGWICPRCSPLAPSFTDVSSIH